MQLMTASNFKVIFRGPAVDAGDIDVRDFSPPLLALGDVFQSTSYTLNGDRVKTAVRVRATDAACFQVDLSVVQSIGETLHSLLSLAAANKDGISAAKELADLLLKTGTAVGGGVIRSSQVSQRSQARKN